jgi:hypothetical protein
VKEAAKAAASSMPGLSFAAIGQHVLPFHHVSENRKNDCCAFLAYWNGCLDMDNPHIIVSISGRS